MHYAFAHMCGQTDGRTPSLHYPLRTINIQTHIDPVMSLYRSSSSSSPSSPSWSYGVIWEGGLGQHWFEVIIRIATGGVPKACMSVCAWVYVFVFVFTGLYGRPAGDSIGPKWPSGRIATGGVLKAWPRAPHLPPHSLHSINHKHKYSNTITDTQTQILKLVHRYTDINTQTLKLNPKHSRIITTQALQQNHKNTQTESPIH